MTTLISCVGDTDPIRNLHDGPLLHIARVYKPDKIILIHSERSLVKHADIDIALKSIKGYNPTIINDSLIIKNSEVFIFDRMFDLLYPVIMSYFKEEEDLLLNLSSGTPQIISAMFSINRLSDYNVRAFQVASPQGASNAGVGHSIGENIEDLISKNKDHQDNYKNRIKEDKAEKFNQVLLIRTFSDLIHAYDYEGAYKLLLEHKLTSKKKRAKMIKAIEAVLHLVKYQEQLPEIESSHYSEKEKLLLNAFLSIQLQHKRQLVSEVLIRTKNLAELISAYYLNKTYPDLMIYQQDKWYLNRDTYPDLHKFLNEEAKKAAVDLSDSIVFNLNHYLSLPVFVNVFKYLEPDSKMCAYLKKVLAINHLRNKVAHGFTPLNPKELKGQNMYTTSKGLISEIISVEQHWFDYFEQMNQELINLLDFK